MDKLKAIVASMEDMKRLQHHQPQCTQADHFLKQFIKSPISIFYEVNPKKTTLNFEGSNYSDWENAIDQTLARNSAFASLIRNSLDPALLTFVDPGNNNKPGDLIKTLHEKHQHHKLMVLNNIIRCQP
ncbi:uncharacterized protein VP01_5157g1 [Puccinia sorghi]|uniref:Uncharacterized protein n=1 Tax=Puccinia sorghi TaxID=27349 RepID=A0A0L6UMX0_9BASI|nr:uncharacterized protein VP01_5157g1 [Puccinia sorghi]